MASDDDERGIDWLASQLDPEGTGADSPNDSAAAASDNAKTDAAKTDAAAPTSRFGRRARRAKPVVAEPEVVEPVEPPVPAAPAGPVPWWNTPLPRSVEVDADTVEAAERSVHSDSADDDEPATALEQEAVPPTDSSPELAPQPAARAEPIAVEPIAPVPSTAELITPAPAPAAAVVPEAVEEQATAATELLPVSAADADAPDSGASIRLAETDQPTHTEAPSRHRSRRVLAGGTQAALVWTAVGLLALIVLVGLFYLGQRLVASPVAAPAPTQSATPTPTPSPTPRPVPEITAAQAAGVHEWNTLFGGECLEPYVSPWEEELTVVDCAVAHTAQLVYRGNFGGDATTVFPGEAALAAQINLLCTAPGILDLNAAGAYPNLQMQGSYPITEEQWTTGLRNYYCFVSRASVEPLAATIMGAGPTA
ncbi:hypothetical protein [Cryobacterium aureum]|uniref:hypothetical protein n=1 Tax=Cryobacterium aureum TaxID=995037 RepID=UPI000CF4F8FD|nr:hypothetical protein [Cryobacterium aureum]